MGWQSDDGQHEGWAAAVFTGGWYSIGGTAGRVMVEHADAPYDPDAPVLREGRQAIGWQARCACGWSGVVRECGQDADLGEFADAPEAVEDAIYAEWRVHAYPEQALEAVREAAEQLAAAQARLNEAVRAARGAGSSWADVGQATGMSRQSAHERWSKAFD